MTRFSLRKPYVCVLSWWCTIVCVCVCFKKVVFCLFDIDLVLCESATLFTNATDDSVLCESEAWHWMNAQRRPSGAAHT